MFAFLFRLRWYMFNFKHFLTILNTRNPEDGLICFVPKYTIDYCVRRGKFSLTPGM